VRFTFGPLATVTAVTPQSGPAAGGTRVTITGTRFGPHTQVMFGAVPGKNLHLRSAQSITVTAPAHKAGDVHVRAVTPYGKSIISPADVFTYTP
jgi:hypothetical protein